MSKKDALISDELYKYLAVALPILDLFTITVVAFTSENPWITTPLNISFPILGIISTRMAVKNPNIKFQQGMYLVILPFMALNLGLLAYYGGLDCPAWVQAFPVIGGAFYLLRNKVSQILISIQALLVLFVAYWLLGESGKGIASILLGVGAYALMMERVMSYMIRQHDTLQQQKTEIEEKNREIIDSISYAKRIQASILPTDQGIAELWPGAFVLYKPKDIVSGDFYWARKEGSHVLFAACDCTGHGVPGAMVSVVCANSLNEAAKRSTLGAPDQLLNDTRKIVIEQFQKSGTDLKDGMDISMCSLDIAGRALRWSGANNPLYIVRKGELLETKADKQPIGQHVDMRPFNCHSIALEPGDCIYLFTDGYHDQFGGAKGKKMKRTHFKDILLSASKEPIEEQKALLSHTFDAWRGSYEQIDDICIIGLKIR